MARSSPQPPPNRQQSSLQSALALQLLPKQARQPLAPAFSAPQTGSLD
jgi:hypothetical protein